MSRGLGKLQRDIMDALTKGGEWRWGRLRWIVPGRWCKTDDVYIAMHVGYGYSWGNDHLKRQVHRALTALVQRGLVESETRPNYPHYRYKTVRYWKAAGIEPAPEKRIRIMDL